MSWAALLVKDARLVVRHRALLVALLLYPLLLALVLGAAFREPPARLDLAFHSDDPDLDETALLEAAAPFATVRRAADAEAAVDLVRRGEVDAALLVPAGFSFDAARLGGNATLRVVVDGSDPVRAGVARSAVVGGIDAYVKRVVAQKIGDVEALLDLTVRGGTARVAFVDVDVLGIERAQQRLREVLATLDEGSAEAAKVRDVIAFLDFARASLGDSERVLTTTSVPVSVEPQGLAPREASLAAVALPGAIVLGVFWTGALAAALLVARERETGAIRRLAAAPVRGSALAASKGVVALAAALLPALALLAIAAGALDAVVADPLSTVLVVLVASLAAVGLGALAAGLARGTSAAALLVVLALLPMLLLGGLFYPVAYMPAAAQAVARALPVTLATDALRGAMLRSEPLVALAPGLAALVALAVGCAGLGGWLAWRRA